MGRLGHGGGGGSSGKDGTERLQRRTWWKGPWSRGEHEEDGAISQNYDRQFGSLPIAGHLWRGTPVGGRVVGGQGHQGPVTRGLSKGFKLPGEHAAPADTQEGRQASAQALGRLHPGAVMEELAHGVSGEVVLRGEGQSEAAQLPSASPQPACAPLGDLRSSYRNLSLCPLTCP